MSLSVAWDVSRDGNRRFSTDSSSISFSCNHVSVRLRFYHLARWLTLAVIALTVTKTEGPMLLTSAVSSSSRLPPSTTSLDAPGAEFCELAISDMVNEEFSSIVVESYF